MRRLAGYVIVAAGITLLPSIARAQIYPERVHEVRRVHEAYQGRDRDERAQAVDKFSRTVHLGADGTLDASNISGDITVTRGSGTDARIDVVRTARGRDDADAKEQLSLVRVDIAERNGRVEIRERYPERGSSDRRSYHLTTDYTISVPPGTHVMLKSVSGDLKVTNIAGEVYAETVSGNVELASGGRVTRAKSISGNVEISDTHFDGSLTADSVSGDVRMQRVSARRIEIGSVSGNVRAEDVQSDRVDAHTTSGNAAFSGSLAANGRYEIKSFSGDVRVGLSGNTGFELDATSFSGDVRCDLPLTNRDSSDERHGRRRSLSGTFGDGSAVLNLTSFSGSVVVSKR
jgi:DUF4097 and DUF4098 domain-containing protein YvlB